MFSLRNEKMRMTVILNFDQRFRIILPKKAKTDE